MTTPTAHRNHKGFTMIEIVFAIAILSIMVTTGYSALSTILSTKNLLDDRRDMSATMSAVVTRMVRELQLANPTSSLISPPNSTESKYPPKTALASTNDELSSGAESDSITFIALEGGQYLPDGGTHTGLVQISYRLEDISKNQGMSQENKIYSLVREEVPLIRPPKRAYEKAITFSISDSVKGLSFYFYDSVEGKWLESWTPGRKTGLPSLVRFSITFADKSGVANTVTTTIPIRGADKS